MLRSRWSLRASPHFLLRYRYGENVIYARYVSAPSKAWRFLRGESPRGVRISHPPLPSVAWKRVTVTRSVHREPYRPQGRPHSLKHIEPRKLEHPRKRNMREATYLTLRKPTTPKRYGKDGWSPSGSENMACMERSVRNLGDPVCSC